MLQYLIVREWRRETNQAELTVKGDLPIMPPESRGKMIPLGFDRTLHSPCRENTSKEAHYYNFQQEGMRFSGLSATRSLHLCL